MLCISFGFVFFFRYVFLKLGLFKAKFARKFFLVFGVKLGKLAGKVNRTGFRADADSGGAVAVRNRCEFDRCGAVNIFKGFTVLIIASAWLIPYFSDMILFSSIVLL